MLTNVLFRVDGYGYRAGGVPRRRHGHDDDQREPFQKPSDATSKRFNLRTTVNIAMMMVPKLLYIHPRVQSLYMYLARSFESISFR